MSEIKIKTDEEIISFIEHRCIAKDIKDVIPIIRKLLYELESQDNKIKDAQDIFNMLLVTSEHSTFKLNLKVGQRELILQFIKQ